LREVGKVGELRKLKVLADSVVHMIENTKAEHLSPKMVHDLVEDAGLGDFMKNLLHRVITSLTEIKEGKKRPLSEV